MSSLIIETPATASPVQFTTVKNFLRVTGTDDDELIQILLDAATEAAEAFTNRSFCFKGYKLGLDAFPFFLDTANNQGAYPPSYYSLPLYSTTMFNYSQQIKLYAAPLVRVNRISYLASADSQWHDLVPFPELWYPGTAVALNEKRMDNNGNVQKCTTPGTTTANPPTWNTNLNGTTTEVTPDPGNEGSGPVAWQNMGQFDATNVLFVGPGGGIQFGSYWIDRDSEPARIFPGPPGALWPPTLYVPNSVQVHYTAGYSADGALVPPRAKTAIMQSVAHWYENREPVVPGVVMELPLHCQMLLWSLRVFDVSPTRG